MKSLLLRLIILLFIAVSGKTFAAENRHEGENEESEHQLKNEVSLFLGATSFLEHDGDYFSPGIDYARRLSEHLLIGAWVEAVLAEETEWTMGIPLYFTIHHFWVRIGPGIELFSEETENELTHETEQEFKAEFLFRTGVGYTFHISHFLISPSIDFDYVRSNDALVYGISFGYGF